MPNQISEQITPSEYFGNWMMKEERLNPQITAFSLGLLLGLGIAALILLSKNR